MVITFSLCVSVNVHAQETGTDNTTVTTTNTAPTPGTVRPKPLMEARKDIREMKEARASTTKAIRGEAKDRMASSTEGRLLKVKEQMKERYKKMIERIQATIIRQETILSKINSRIQKIKTNGGNTTEAEKYTAEAKVKIDLAKISLETLKSTINGGINNVSSTTESIKKETFEKMKNNTKEIEKYLRDAHQLLQKSIGSLKGMSQIKNPNATSTSATTTSSN